MSCSHGTLVKHEPGLITAMPAWCRAFTCEHCAPYCQRRVAERIKLGRPNMLITLTVDPARYADPDAAQRGLADAWRVIRREARRLWANGTLPFFAVVEAHKSGWPHLHIAARASWVGQAWLSERMLALTGGRVCDVRRTRSQRGLAKYLAKYLTKSPHRFGTSKRYWCSQDWLPDDARDTLAARRQRGQWSYRMQECGHYVIETERLGFISVEVAGAFLLSWPQGP